MPNAVDTGACPKCARPRAPGALECPSCGVVYARFRAQPRRAELSAAKAHSGHVPIAAARLEELLSFAAGTIESGVPLGSLASTGALATLPRPVAEKLDADLRAGVPLSQSLDELQALDPGSRALIRAGEIHGGIPDALHTVVARLTHRRKVRVGLLLALAYPAFLLLAAALVLPLPVAFREGMRAYVAHVAPPVLALVTAALLALVVAPRLPPDSPLRRGPRWLVERMPVGRTAVLHSALASFAGVLGACLNAGIPARKAVVLAAEGAAPHSDFAGAGERLVEKLDGGATLAEALGVIPSVPAAFVAQVGTAEVLGKLGSVLPALEDEHEKKARFSWVALASVVGTVVFAVVLAVLAFQVVRGWGEVFKSQAQQLDELVR
jgi:type II secretory pathway component PulF